MIGKRLGRYEIVEKIGEGGMGVVYRGRDERLGRDVAIKILSEAIAAEPRHRTRLEREARVLAALDHRNIAAVHDLEETNGTVALVMELVEGPTLAERIRGGSLPLPELLSIGRQIAEGLRAAHERGIIHRDLKPSNIKVTPAGVVKLLDFGLAKEIRPPAEPDSSDRTAALIAADLSGTAGTLPYMAPEQLRGDPLDARTDIHALGVILYEMATGRLPYGDARGAALIGEIQYGVPVPPREVNPDLPRRLEDVILKCQEKDPARRFASAARVGESLRLVETDPEGSEGTLAVLYFENLSPAREDAYFRDGITEDIIIELSRIRGLTVLPRSSVLAFRDKPMDVGSIGRRLDARYVLEGTLRRVGDRLRVTAELVDARRERSLWAERWDRQVEDVFAIQDEIARNIAAALRLVLSEAERRSIVRVPTSNIAAYDYYLRGRQHFQLFRRRSIEHALEMFAAAVEIDPSYARAWAGLADCNSYLYMFWEAAERYLGEADRASRRAVDLAGDLAEAHVARGVAISLGKRYDEAAAEYAEAIRLDPSLFEAYYFQARGFYAQGRLEEAVAWFERASAARPEDYQPHVLRSSALGGLGRKEESAAASRRGLDLAQRHLDLNPGDTRAIYFSAICLCQLGERREQALEWARRALAMDPEEPQVLYNVACVYALLGETDGALECLASVIAHGDWWRIWMANDPDLASLHGNPRFAGILGTAAPADAVG